MVARQPGVEESACQRHMGSQVDDLVRRAVGLDATDPAQSAEPAIDDLGSCEFSLVEFAEVAEGRIKEGCHRVDTSGALCFSNVIS